MTARIARVRGGDRAAGAGTGRRALVALVLAAATGCGTGGGPGTPPAVDLLPLAGAAVWRAGTGALTFDEEPEPAFPVVRIRRDARLEDGSVATVLETRVSNFRFVRAPDVRVGFVSGAFTLPEPIRPGDRIRARVGLLEGVGSGVEFTVRAGGRPAPVARVSDGPDGELKELDADLSAHAGSREIEIEVDAGGTTGVAAVWVDLRIERIA